MGEVHRGRSKQNAKTLTITLTPSEYQSLCELAESEMRTAAAQAAWLIRMACNQRGK